MSVMSMNSRMAMAEKLSIPQLQQAIQSGSLPAYIGVPLIEQKTREKSQMAAASQGQQEPRPSITQQILQQAEQQQRQQADPGIDQLPSNLPQGDDEEMGMANGGIIAFAGEGPSLVSDPLDPRQEQPSKAPEESLSTQTKADRAYLKDMYNKFGAAIVEGATIPFRALGSTGNLFNRALRATGLDVPNIPGKYTLDSGQSMTPFYDDIRKTAGETALPQPKALDLDSQYVAQDMQEGNRGITPLVDNRGAAPRGAVNTSGATRPSTGNGQPSVGETPPQTAGGSTTSPATSLIDRYTKMLEAQGEDSAQARRDAKGMAIFQAGLGIAGGTSPNAFANISQGALPAIQGYQQALQGLRKEDRDRVTKLLEAGLSEEKLAIELQKLGIENKKVDAMVNYYNARAGAAGSGGSDTKNNAAYNLATRNYDTGIGNIDKQIAKLKENTAYQYPGKLPALIASKKIIQDQIDVLDRKKTNMSKQYRIFVTERLGIANVPDFSGAAGGGDPADPFEIR